MVFLLKSLNIISFVFFLMSCTHTALESPGVDSSPTQDIPVVNSGKKPAKAIEKDDEVVQPVVLPQDPCFPHKMTGPRPWFIPELAIVITQASHPCVTRDGVDGFRSGPQFMVMGFPCTAGRGRLAYQGNYYLPKIASFILATECPMLNADPEKVLKKIVQHGRFPDDSQVVTFNPFVTQYWELESFSDADVGFAVDVTSNEALHRIWHPWKEGKGFEVRLYGRENSWIKERSFYEVRGRIEPSGGNTFQLVLKSVSALNQVQENAVKERCEQLKPRRRCDAVFM